MVKRVLISGASIAGPSLAFWLDRHGFDVTVVERAPAVRPGGYAVDFRGTAMRVLERMGLIEAVKERETRTGSITMVDADGKVVTRLPDGFTSGDLEILRGDLAEVLYGATRGGAQYLFGDSIQAMVEKAEGVEVTFASGSTRQFDIVVGADGLHSSVRALAFGERSRFVRPMGYGIAVFTLPDFLHLGNAGRYHVELGKRVGCFGTPNDGRAKATFYFASDAVEYDRDDVAAQKRLLREIFAGVKWEAQRMLAMLDAATDFYFDSLSQVKMDAWSRGRVVLLGDAACCPSPMSGMGTSLATVGAYVLAAEMKAAGGDYPTAFAKYEVALRGFAAEAQKLAESVSWFIPRTRVKLWLSKRLWSWMPQGMLKRLMIEEPSRIASLVRLEDLRRLP
ncbi:MAG TPA: FAD-dependent monooxygenase [Steroidobacteraceae bacterium]|nr:FAD-dependent monooxygenase [Steroidobacteraceae bacterium]